MPSCGAPCIAGLLDGGALDAALCIVFLADCLSWTHTTRDLRLNPQALDTGGMGPYSVLLTMGYTYP
jgi:hypothetical protein